MLTLQFQLLVKCWMPEHSVGTHIDLYDQRPLFIGQIWEVRSMFCNHCTKPGFIEETDGRRFLLPHRNKM